MIGRIGVEAYGTMPGYAGGALVGAEKERAAQTYIAKLEGVLRLACRVLVDGDPDERLGVAEQIQSVLPAGQGS